MGYSGLVVIARTGDTRLDDLACIEDLLVVARGDLRVDGWRIGFLGQNDDTSPGRLAADLALETAAPAIAMWVVDSDCAFAVAEQVSGERVEFYLNEEIVETYLSLANAYLSRQSNKEAMDAVDEALAVDPKNSEALATRARIQIASSNSSRWKW